MAHNSKFSQKDLELTNDFLKDLEAKIKGKMVLDICGGISRCGSILSNMFDKIDVCDLLPSFGQIAPEKQGELITSNLKDI